ncbi:hypothetical protein HK100_004737, partial [Physocladia obscura]
MASNPGCILPLQDGLERSSRPVFAALLQTADAFAKQRNKKPNAGAEARFLADQTKLLLSGRNSDTTLRSGNRVLLFVSSTFTGTAPATNNQCVLIELIIKTDTAWERNNNIKDVYPYLRNFCQRLGLTFESVDMRWGVLDSSTAEHLTSELCLRQLQKCLEESAGPAFFSILGNKYGYRPFPPTIAKRDFEDMRIELDRLCTLSDEELYNRFHVNNLVQDKLVDAAFLKEQVTNRKILQLWWDLDENAVLPVYVLKPSLEKGRAELWKNDEGIFMRLFRVASWNLDCHHIFVQSVTEDEVHHGITRPEKFIGVQRHYNDIQRKFNHIVDSISHSKIITKTIVRTTRLISLETAENMTPFIQAKTKTRMKMTGADNSDKIAQLKSLSNFIDAHFETKKWTVDGIDYDAVAELDRLKKEMIVHAKREFNVPWRGAQFEPDLPGNEDQAAYIREFADFFCTSVCKGILKWEESRFRLAEWDSLVFELVAIANFRASLVAELKDGEFVERVCVKEVKIEAGGIHVVSGGYGTGKSAVLSQVQNALSSNDPDCFIVSRYVGETENSANIRQLLASLCAQLLRIYSQNPNDAMEALAQAMNFDDTIPWFTELQTKFEQTGMFSMDLTYEDLAFMFGKCLEIASEEKRIVLIIDSVDKLWTETEFSLSWIPSAFFEKVSIILSALPDSSFTKALRQRIETNEAISFSESLIPELTPAEISEMINSLLANKKRTLTQPQHNYIMSQVKANPRPLYVKMAWKYFQSWQSYLKNPTFFSPENYEKSGDLIALYDTFLNRLEHRYGELLVTHALSYLAAAKRGLSTLELEDLLSLDDKVLNIVFQYWTPPLRRIPSALWVRIRDELGDLLAEVSVDGVIVYKWQQPDFKDCIIERYLKPETSKSFHANLADYWSSKYSGDVRKEYTKVEKKGNKPDVVTKESEIRYVSEQPVFFQAFTKPNLRRLSQEPWHLLKAHRFQDLAKLLEDPKYILAIIVAGESFLRDILSVYDDFANDKNHSEYFTTGVFKFREFLMSNFGRITRGTKEFIAIATDLPKNSHVGICVRKWAQKQPELLWLDRVNRPLEEPNIKPIMTMLDTSKVSAPSYSGKCWLVWPDSPKLKPLYVTVGLRSDFFRVVTFWDITKQQRVANFTFSSEKSPTDDPIPLVCCASPDGSKFAIGSGSLSLFSVIKGGSGVDLALLAEEHDLVDEVSSNRRIIGIRWTSNSKYIVFQVIFGDNVERLELRDGETMERISRWEPPLQELVFAGDFNSTQVFISKQSQLLLLDIDEWEKNPNTATPPFKESLKLPYIFEFNHQPCISVAKNSPLITLVNPENALEIWNIELSCQVSTIPSFNVSNLFVAILNHDGTYIALSEGSEVHIISLNGAETLLAGKLLSPIQVTTDVKGFEEFTGIPTFVPDGRHIITTGEGNSHLLWDLLNIQQMSTLNIQENSQKNDEIPHVQIPILAIMSGDVQFGFAIKQSYGEFQLVDCNGDRVGLVRVVDTENSESDLVLSADAHPSKPLAVVSTKTELLILIDLSDFNQPVLIKIKTDILITACTFFNTNYIKIATASKYGAIEVWDYLNSTLTQVSSSTYNDIGFVRRLFPSPCGNYIGIQAHFAKFCMVHQIKNPDAGLIILPEPEDISSALSIGMSFNPTNPHIVAVSMSSTSSGDRGCAILCNWDSLEFYYVREESVLNSTWILDGHFLICVCEEQKVLIFRVNSANDDCSIKLINQFFINSASPWSCATLGFSSKYECHLALLDEEKNIQVMKFMGSWWEHVLDTATADEADGTPEWLTRNNVDDDKYFLNSVSLYPDVSGSILTRPGRYKVLTTLNDDVVEESFKETHIAMFTKLGKKWGGVSSLETVITAASIDWPPAEKMEYEDVVIPLGDVIVYCDIAFLDLSISPDDSLDRIW